MGGTSAYACTHLSLVTTTKGHRDCRRDRYAGVRRTAVFVTALLTVLGLYAASWVLLLHFAAPY